jgi:hypothetical protein
MTRGCKQGEAYFDGLIYFVNCFFGCALKTAVLRDEDVVFPQTTDNFSPDANKFVKSYNEVNKQLSEAVKEADQGSKGLLSIMQGLCTVAGRFFDVLQPLTK